MTGMLLKAKMMTNLVKVRVTRMRTMLMEITFFMKTPKEHNSLGRGPAKALIRSRDIGIITQRYI